LPDSVFKRLRDALEAALASATPPEDLYDLAGRMRGALVEARAGLDQMRDALEKTERELAALKREIETAERRRSLAAGIEDAETVAVADGYLAKHRERAVVLERKAAAQREEIALAERDVAEMTGQLEEVTKRRGTIDAERSSAEAWASLGRAGVDRPELDAEQEALKARMDRAAREAEADAKLEELKKRMGKG
jgi:chromosome segregation ATPase